MGEPLKDPFEGALFYGGEYDEELTFTEWDEYLWFVMDSMEEDDLFEESITVTAYRRTPLDESPIRDAAHRMADSVADDEWCDFEEHVCPHHWKKFLDPDAVDELRQGLQAVLSRVIRARGNFWGCEEVAKRVFTPSELRDFWESNHG